MNASEKVADYLFLGMECNQVQYQPQMMMCGAISGMIGRGNQSTWRKPVPVLLCPPQKSHNLTWATMVESQ
jgi:hypothetical protein